MALLENPSLIFRCQKKSPAGAIAEINPLASNFAFLLVSKGILKRSGDISEKYNDLLDAHRGIERAKVTTVLPLGDQEKEAISQRLGKIIQRQGLLLTLK